MSTSADPSEVYRSAFANPNYAPFEHAAFRYRWAIDFLQRQRCRYVLDLGCGRGGLQRACETIVAPEWYGADLDVFSDCVWSEFIRIDLADYQQHLPDRQWDCVTCLDVLEHLTRDGIPHALDEMARHCHYAVVTVANHSDRQGGVELHLTQEPAAWWGRYIGTHFKILEERWPYKDGGMVEVNPRTARKTADRLFAFYLESIHV